MKTTDFFELVKNEEKNEKLRMFRDNARIIGTQVKEFGKDIVAVVFGGIVSNLLIPGITIPMPVNYAIGGVFALSAAHARFKYSKNRIKRRRDDFKHARNELERLRFNICMKLSDDADKGLLSFSSNEKTLSARFLEIVKNREDISVRIKKNGAASFYTAHCTV